MDLLTITATMVIGFSAGFVGSMVGGAGLISIPSLIFMGVAPQVAIATVRISGLCTTLVGIFKYKKAKKIDVGLFIKTIVIISIGTFIGSNLLFGIEDEILKRILGIFLIPLLILLLYKKNIGLDIQTEYVDRKIGLFGYIILFFIGIWSGLVGAGYSILIMYVFLLIFGKRFLEAIGTLHLIGFVVIMVSFPVFALSGIIDYDYGLILMASGGLGGYVGSSLALRKGDKWVRILFIGFMLLVTISMLLG